MTLPQPKTVKEAAAILAEVHNSGVMVKQADPSWFQTNVTDPLAGYVRGLGNEAVTGALFNEDNSPTGLGTTLAGGLVGAGVGGLGGLATGLTRKKKKPLRDTLTGALLGGLGGAGIGAAAGYGPRLFEVGPGQEGAGVRAGLQGMQDDQGFNQGGTQGAGDEVENLTRLGEGLWNNPSHAWGRYWKAFTNPGASGNTVNPAQWAIGAGVLGGGGYLGLRGLNALRNAGGRFSTQSASTLQTALNGQTGNSALNPVNTASLQEVINTAQGRAWDPKWKWRWHSPITGRYGALAPFRAVRNLWEGIGPGRIAQWRVNRASGIRPSPLGGPSLRGTLGSTAIPAGLSYIVASGINAGNQADVIRNFVQSQLDTNPGITPERLVELYDTHVLPPNESVNDTTRTALTDLLNELR